MIATEERLDRAENNDFCRAQFEFSAVVGVTRHSFLVVEIEGNLCDFKG